MTSHAPTYIEWLRTATRGSLDRADRKKLAEDQEWVEAHPKEHARLQAFIGQLVRLKHDRKTFEGGTLLAGTVFEVFERWEGCLYGRSPGGTAYALQPNWIEAVDLPKKKTADG